MDAIVGSSGGANVEMREREVEVEGGFFDPDAPMLVPNDFPFRPHADSLPPTAKDSLAQ